ncbi:Hypothetical predicted protein [Paramuricea clavata]|uniref:Uncharacterized protein n=1 Tax=Paramuricea clavata TaxID=317549 RepID=A0A6S7FXF6_PARCT|nr:Hypothetical predicted protein [Paramuricea clavata]
MTSSKTCKSQELMDHSDVLAHQLKIYLNIITTSGEIQEEIAREAKKDLFDKDVHSQNNAINEISELKAAATTFLTDIVFNGANQHTVIKAKCRRPLYVVQHKIIPSNLALSNMKAQVNGLDQQSLKYNNTCQHVTPDQLHYLSDPAHPSVVFNPVVDGEIKPPFSRVTSRRTAEELVQKEEKAVFDKAMTEFKSYWDGACFNGYDISTKITKTNSDQLLFDDYKTVKTFLKCPIRDLHKFSNLTTGYKCMFKHIDHHANKIIFMKCDDRSCCSIFKSLGLKEFLEIQCDAVCTKINNYMWS